MKIRRENFILEGAELFFLVLKFQEDSLHLRNFERQFKRKLGYRWKKLTLISVPFLLRMEEPLEDIDSYTAWVGRSLYLNHNASGTKISCLTAYESGKNIK